MNSVHDTKIVIVGYGWVGQANAIALSKMGYSVWFYDTAENPNFHYVDDIEEHDIPIRRAKTIQEVDGHNTWFIVCVGDRVSEEYEQDISLIKKATDSLKQVQGRIILRSTVLPQKLHELYFDLYVPEFLHEKNAVEECLNPFYFVVGIQNEVPVPSFMKEWERRAYKIFKGTPQQASYIKYLSNIWNSIRIAFVNEMGDSMGNAHTIKDIKDIERVLDFVLERKSYLRYGQGFDGHCLPKDTRAYIGAHEKVGKNVDLLKGAYASNEHHKVVQENKILPKVFSFWEYEKTKYTIFNFVWNTVNQYPTVKKVRKRMRFVVDGLSQLIPDRSINNSVEMWETKAKENPMYFSNPRTKNGTNVNENELQETGKTDYEQYVTNDPVFSEIFKIHTNKKVLDFGSGVGRMTDFFANDFEEVHGIDISKTMIECAKKRTPSNRNITYTVFDGSLLPYASEYFDAIFSYLVFQHVPSYLQVENYLRAFNRILKKDGIAKIQLRGGRGVKKWEWSYGVPFTLERAITLVESTGFTLVDHQVEGVKHIWLTIKK